nr:MAG TPA: hypothetical protein [Caudoviricetes sp.]
MILFPLCQYSFVSSILTTPFIVIILIYHSVF